MTKHKKPILITGSHRCGSTWVGNMLGLSSGTQEIYEPFNVGSWSYRMNNNIEYWFEYIQGSEKEHFVRDSLQKILNNKAGMVYGKRNLKRYLPFLRNGRHLIKDPIAAFSSEWMNNEFEFEVVVVVRHPMAFVKSLERVNWKFDFQNFLKQTALMSDHLSVFKNELLNTENLSFREQALLLWKCIYHVLETYLKRNKKWILVRHEDLALDPLTGFKELYDKLNLDWDDYSERQIIKSTSSANPMEAKGTKTHQLNRDSAQLAKSWRNYFTEKEINNYKSKIEPHSKFFYTNEYW